MKRMGISRVLLLIVALGYSVVAAQIVEIAPAEASRRVLVARSKSLKMDHRSIMTAERFASRDGQSVWRSRLTRETVSPNRSRWQQVTEVPEGSLTIEVITIDGDNYRKLRNGPWEKMEPPKSTPASQETPASRPSVALLESKAEILEKTQLAGKDASYYKLFRRTLIQKDGTETIQITTEEYWFDQDGRLVREKRELEFEGKPEIVVNDTKYEFDNIRIEAPIQ